MKIDVSKIPGYADMSPEEKVAAFEAYDAPVVSKASFDETASALSKKKKELEAFLSDDQKAKAAEQEQRDELQKANEKLQQQIDALLRETQVAKNKAELIALGYEDTLALDTAEAMANGDFAKVLANQKAHLTAAQTKWEQDALMKAGKPVPGGSSNTMTLENFRKLSADERWKYAQAHPEEYKQLYQKTGG